MCVFAVIDVVVVVVVAVVVTAVVFVLLVSLFVSDKCSICQDALRHHATTGESAS